VPPANADFAAFCAELLSGAGDVRSKRMFGGYGLYVDDLFVAIFVADTLYLKADEQTQERFQAAVVAASPTRAKASRWRWASGRRRKRPWMHPRSCVPGCGWR
jgi:TfoX/Sxy family transcriptional regulator of competence genes